MNQHRVDGAGHRPAFTLAISCAFVALACSRPGGPDAVKDGFPTQMQIKPPTNPPNPPLALTCDPLTSAEPLPARSTAVSAMASGTAGSTYFTTDLFNSFKTFCGGCHVDSSRGNPPFHVTANTFSDVFLDQGERARALNAIQSDDPTKYMPPDGSGGMPFSKRGPDDPIVQLYNLLTLWTQQGCPPNAFMLPSDGNATTTDYSLTPQLAAALTNIGSCVPGKDMVATNGVTMDQLDAHFASATELPDNLADTDLVTLDSDMLARNGVISYAPAYPLWSDDAGKMRYVRVPHGQSIKFDKATQQFQIPPNTRFYKTFLKKVVDADGNTSFRKIETRIIVSRPDVNLADGTAQQTALYGTYVWNADETEAVLLTDPLRNGKPFRDRLISYITDEVKAQSVADNLPAGENLGFALQVENPGLVRHYAIPGSERCVQCHMGSPSQSFVLGFTPLQVALIAKGQSGVIEPAVGDELTQLARLISYGVVSGMTSQADVLPLERSQGSRAPRNDAELGAQAYMLGNCSHCHNPRGFPTRKEPALKDLLNFLPGPNGGIFQFPLDRSSPVRYRTASQDVPIPYVTPSVRDYPSPDASYKFFCPYIDRTICDTNPDLVKPWVVAPWRSLIYRNVDAPFDYFDDRTIFPHMPLNSPGYDCRAARIMGDWMVSIPAVLQHPGLDEDDRPYDNGKYPSDVNNDAQPYVEVLPGDPRYANAVAAAQQRLDEYHAGYRYTFCPDTNDIVDPFITDEVDRGVPVTTHSDYVVDPSDPTKMIMPDLGVPIHANWVVTDATDPPGDWYPRRIDWDATLVSHTNPPSKNVDLNYVVAALDGVSLTSGTRTALTTEVPFGLWVKKPSCTFDSIATVDSFTGDSRPQWMDVARPDAKAPVFSQSPGAALFTTICFNCHGPQADSKGLLADEITLMTGGDARVANFRDGLFGPVSDPGANRTRVFQPFATQLGGGLTGEDLAARYMAFMALGDTQKNLPDPILIQVSYAPVLGQTRGPQVRVQGTPDMLRLGLTLCAQVLPADFAVPSLKLESFIRDSRLDWGAQTGLIDVNGDAEMWLRVCSLNNRQVVRVVYGWTTGSGMEKMIVSPKGGLYWADTYPATAPVMDHRGRVVNGVKPDNLFPLCFTKPATPDAQQDADKFLHDHPVGGSGGTVIPYCPPELFGSNPTANQLKYDSSSGTDDFTDARRWAARGAINGALAVYLYLEELERTKAKPLYNQCDMLGGTM